jgi:hypothetical protein
MKSNVAAAAALLLLVQPMAACTTTDEPADSPSTHPTPPAGHTTLRGMVRRGVEAGCMVLRSSGQDYLLIGESSASLAPGDRVSVTGEPKPHVATNCMQGIPFHVDNVQLKE